VLNIFKVGEYYLIHSWSLPTVNFMQTIIRLSRRLCASNGFMYVLSWYYQSAVPNESFQKKIKRKEYYDASAFMADVELIFSNAIEYNADHSMIWEDAHSLRVSITLK
jgi:Bromodomain